MATPVIMPRQGQSVESCLFSSWYVEKGARVNKGDLLFSYETDKAAFDAESPADGFLLATFAAPGDLIPVLQNVAVIGEHGENWDHLVPGTEITRAPENKPDHDIQAADSPVKSAGNQPSGGEVRISPRAKKAAKNLKVSPAGISGSGPEGRILEKDIISAAAGMPKATPLAKSIAYGKQLPVPEQGSGPGGKVMASDIREKQEIKAGIDFEEKPLSNVRKIIARNMLSSLQNTAQLTLHSTADARKLLSLRKNLKAEKDEMKQAITINDLVCFAVVQALLKHPAMNAHFLGEFIRYYRPVNLGFAVDTDRGLMVPTLFNADKMSLPELSAGLKSLAAQAQKGNIDPQLLSGATFTVTNLGALGVEMFTPVLNPPQTGILGINAITYRPGDTGDGTISFIPVIGLSLTFDHRAIDGAPAALFLRDVAGHITRME
jgi:pyruvate dehydrogenase E2 component (dihydrolipoamide acetyltransferase)